MAFMDDQINKCFHTAGISGDLNLYIPVMEIDLSLSQAIQLLEAIKDIDDHSSIDRTHALARATIALLAQLGPHIDYLNTYAAEGARGATKRRQATNIAGDAL